MGTYVGPDGLLHNHTLDYPTMEEVNGADRLQLGRWFRFLPSAGSEWVNYEDFKEKMEAEKAVIDRVIERFTEAGGMDSVLSKQIGWTL
jgi:hypothetical protein